MDKTNIAKKIDALIKESSNILVVGHSNPDPDALSAVIGLYYIIHEQYGKTVQALCERTPANLSFIPGYSEVIHTTLLDRIKNGGHDLIILLDFNQWHMTSRKDFVDIKQEVESQQIPLILIDHHATAGKDIDATEYFREEPTSTCSNVHLLFHKLLGLDILPQVADHLLIGILADTNRFRYRYDAPTEATVLEYCAELVKKSTRSIEQISIDLDRIDSRRLDIIATFMKNIRILNTNTVYATLSDEDIAAEELDTTQIGDSATYITNNVITYIDTAKRGFIVYPRLVEENTFTVRFRSNSPEFPVTQWAEDLGGGGHPQSAAALVKATTIENALEQVLAVVERD